MTDTTENQAIIDTAIASVEPYAVDRADGSGIYLTHDDDGDTQIIDLRAELGLLPTRPTRKTGATIVTDVDSFIEALSKHELPETEYYGNARRGTIRAVINADQGTVDGKRETEAGAGHGDHTITLQLPFTTDWTDWTGANGEQVKQQAFAEFIEDHAPNFVQPTSADMLELAQTFQATTKVDFASSQRVSSGETQLQYVENTSASAGRRGALSIPDRFDIALAPYERGDVYRVGARFRYRIVDSNLTLGYRLDRPDDVLRSAFDDIVAKVQDATGRSVWHTT